MNEEHKKILKQKKEDERKAILITIIVVLVVALMVLAVILLLPEKTTNTDNTVSGIIDTSDETSAQISEEEKSVDGVTSEVEHESDEKSHDISEELNETSEETSNTDSLDTSTNTDELIHKWVINNMGYTYIYGDTGLEQFNANESTMERYANTINTLKKTLPGNVKVFNILVPTNVEFVDIPRKIYSEDNFYNSSQMNTINGIIDKLDKDIVTVNIYDTLSSKKDEYLYFRTDINWTSLAAYYAYCDFASAAGFSPVNLNDFDKETYEGFLGRFYSATNEPSLAKNPDIIEYYLTDKNNSCNLTVYNKGVTYSNYSLVGNEVSSKANGYNVFLGIEAEHHKITTGAANNKKLLIVSDTSAAAFIPFLVEEYSEIHYVNPNLYKNKISDLVAQNGIGQVLFMNYITNANRQGFTNVLSQLDGVVE